MDFLLKINEDLTNFAIWSASYASAKTLGVWCKSKELGGRGSTRFPTPMAESFSADFLQAIESYWTESHLQFCQSSTTELL